MKKRVVILFPGSAHRPIGGHKVVYEYANRFVADGYEVDMVYPAFKYRYGKFQLGEFLWRFSYATLNYIIRYLFFGNVFINFSEILHAFALCCPASDFVRALPQSNKKRAHGV